MITMTVHRRGGDLPIETTRLVGRRQELAELGRRCDESRLVTVTGVGGVGKTRLALRVAAELSPRFADGVYWVELSPLEDGSSVPYAIAAALPLVDQTMRPMIDVVADYLAGRELLLVLDTCEHLAPSCSLVVQALLASAPGLRILATSRRVLAVPFEQILTLDPLPVSGATDAAAGPGGDAVTLLADRAAAVVPGFQLTAADRADAVRLCQRLDGLPLAIELAAARLDELPLAELTRRLEDRFALLGDTESRSAQADPPWHQSLRTAIGWSHELCSPAERLAWARLSVFAGGFEPEAAQRVCAGGPLDAEELPGLLSALVEASVLQRSDTPRGSRYSMLDTIREYGQAWLGDLGEEHAVRERHRGYFRSLASRAAENWMGRDQLAWHERATAEHANLRLALDACLTDPNPGPALEMAGNLWFFWNCGFGREGLSYLDRALAADPDPEDSPERFWALWACAVLEVNRGNPDGLIDLDGTCTPLADRLGDPAAIAAARTVKAWRLTLLGEHQPAVEFLGDVARWPSQGGGLLTARLLGLTALSFTHLLLGQLDQATATATPLLQECEHLGEHWIRGFARYFLAMAALGNGEHAAAIDHARGAIGIKWRLRDVFGAAMAVDTLAPATAAAEPEQAARLLGISDTLWHTIGAAQLGVAELIAARQACERQIRDAIGDAAYLDAHKSGLDLRPDEGIGYALNPR